MAMSQSERLRRIQEESNRYLARAKTRDSSELTLMRQAQASKTAIPVAVKTSQVRDSAVGTDCCAELTIKGKGTNMEYTNVLQRAQACAVCSDPNVSVLSRAIELPTPCYNRSVAPFSQQLAPTDCKPGFQTFFPPKPVRGPSCDFQHLPYDS